MKQLRVRSAKGSYKPVIWARLRHLLDLAASSAALMVFCPVFNNAPCRISRDEMDEVDRLTTERVRAVDGWNWPCSGKIALFQRADECWRDIPGHM